MSVSLSCPHLGDVTVLPTRVAVDAHSQALSAASIPGASDSSQGCATLPEFLATRFPAALVYLECVLGSPRERLS
jgi:hypothetical protein